MSLAHDTCRECGDAYSAAGECACDPCPPYCPAPAGGDHDHRDPFVPPPVFTEAEAREAMDAAHLALHLALKRQGG